MPGKNHGEIRQDDFCWDGVVLPYAYHATILATTGLEFLGLFRFYYIQDESWAYSNACYMHTLFFILIDIPLFWSLTKTRSEDPGYMLPPGVGEN